MALTAGGSASNANATQYVAHSNGDGDAQCHSALSSEIIISLKIFRSGFRPLRLAQLNLPDASRDADVLSRCFEQNPGLLDRRADSVVRRHGGGGGEVGLSGVIV